MSSPALPLILLLILGWACRRLPLLPPPAETRRTLNTVVISVFLPALMFRVMASTTLDGAFLLVPLIAAVSLALSALVALALYKIWQGLSGRKLPPATLGALIFCASFGNITFLGLPLLTAYYGAAVATKVALLYDSFCLGPLVYGAGPLFAEVFVPAAAHRRRKLGRFNPFRTVFSMPPFQAVAVGIVFQLLAIPLPATVDATLVLMGQAVIPLIVFSVGMALEIPLSVEEWHGLAPLLPALFVKLCATPALTVALLKFAHLWADSLLSTQETQAIALEGAMPTMVVTVVVAESVGLDHKIAARMVALSTALSMITIPWWHRFIS